jgi:hypothetical protein
MFYFLLGVSITVLMYYAHERVDNPKESWGALSDQYVGLVHDRIENALDIVIKQVVLYIGHNDFCIESMLALDSSSVTLLICEGIAIHPYVLHINYGEVVTIERRPYKTKSHIR